MTAPKLSVDDPEFVEKIIFEVKSQGHFDSFRKEMLADVDTQPAFQNLVTRVEDSVQRFLNRQVWTPETNKVRLREDMRHNIVRAGYLESGVSRIVDQVVEQKMDFIHSKVEEILYNYVGISKPIKREKLPSGSLEIQTDLLPTDLEQVSPDSDKKSLNSDTLNMEESKGEEVEEEIVEDEDFESPAFEPIESITMEKNENSNHSNLSVISGLTSQDSVENKLEATEMISEAQDTQLSKISSTQEMSQDFEAEMDTKVEAEMVAENRESGVTTKDSLKNSETSEPKDMNESNPSKEVSESLDEKMEVDTQENPPEKSNFDFKKDSIEFTGNERKSITLDEPKTPFDADKILQPQDVPANTMEIDNLYENDTTDSSETRMEIDLKDDTTRETAESSKIEESSQDSSVSKEKHRSMHRKESFYHHHRKDERSRDKDRSRDRHKSSSHKSRHESRHKSRSDGKSSSHKKSSHRSSSDRRDHEKDRKSSKDEGSKSKHKTDDHHQEKSSRRRRSTDDSSEGKGAGPDKTKGPSMDPKTVQTEKPEGNTSEDKSTEKTETSLESKLSPSKKELKSSILIKYDYLKSSTPTLSDDKIEDGFCGFTAEKLPDNPWFECLRKETAMKQTKRTASNILESKKSDLLSIQIPKSSKKSKAKTLDSPGEQLADQSTKILNGGEENTQETRAKLIAQQQRYSCDDLYKPRFDLGRSRRRGTTRASGENADEAQGSKTEAVSNEQIAS